MIEGKTSNGFNYSIDDDARDDMELLDAFIEIDEGNVKKIKTVLRSLLGEEQTKALYEHCRNPKSGRVSTKAVMKTLTEILNDAKEEDKPLKNS